MKKCSFCAEEIQSEAIKCRHCGERLDTKPTADVGEQQASQEKLRRQELKSNTEVRTTADGVQYNDTSKESEGVIHCVQCNKSILSDVIKCPYCGEENIGRRVQLDRDREASKKESPPVSSPRQSTVATPPIDKKNQEPYKFSSWKSIILRGVIWVVVSFILLFASKAAGIKPPTYPEIFWTVLWIYLSIKAWKYWKWKALLPYPVCIVSGVILGNVASLFVGYNVLNDPVTNSRIIDVISAVLNIGGLIIFYWLLRKSQLEHKDVKDWYLSKKSSALIFGIIVVIGIVITVVISWDRHVIARDGRFIAYDNGTVLDTRTKLMWAAKDNGSDIDWSGAKIYCENYHGGGYTDWRMPKLYELEGLYDASKSRQAACTIIFGNIIHVATELIDITCITCWASETSGSDAAVFYFGRGARFWWPQSYWFRALPVRSAK